MRGRMPRREVDEDGKTRSVVPDEHPYAPNRVTTNTVIFKDSYLSRLCDAKRSQENQKWENTGMLDQLTPRLRTLQIINDDYTLISECLWESLWHLKLNKVVEFRFHGMQNLTHVELRSMSVPIASLKQIIRLPALVSLRVSGMLLVIDQIHTVASIWPSEGSKTLTSLDYGGWHTHGEELEVFIRHCSALTRCRIHERTTAFFDSPFILNRTLTELHLGSLIRHGAGQALNHGITTLSARTIRGVDVLRFKALTSLDLTCDSEKVSEVFCKQLSSALLSNSLPALSVLGCHPPAGSVCVSADEKWGASVRFLYQPLEAHELCTVLQITGCIGRGYTPRHVISSSCSKCDRTHDAYQTRKERNRSYLHRSQILCVLHRLRSLYSVAGAAVRPKERAGICEIVSNVVSLASPWITSDWDPKGGMNEKKNRRKR